MQVLRLAPMCSGGVRGRPLARLHRALYRVAAPAVYGPPQAACCLMKGADPEPIHGRSVQHHLQHRARLVLLSLHEPQASAQHGSCRGILSLLSSAASTPGAGVRPSQNGNRFDTVKPHDGLLECLESHRIP